MSHSFDLGILEQRSIEFSGYSSCFRHCDTGPVVIYDKESGPS